MALPTLKQYQTHEISYTVPLLSVEEKDCLNRMIGEAAFDRVIEHRLVHERDDSLRNRFQLTPTIWSYIQAIKANSLEEFCAEVSKLQHLTISH